MQKCNDFIPVCSPYLAGNELKYITQAVSTQWISSSGDYVKKFEDSFKAWTKSRYAISCCNGTVALHMALVALGIGKNDEVILPSFTMIATAFAVCYTGAMPVFVDINRDTWNINTSLIEEKITPRTRAIMPVHIFGNPCNMAQIKQIATAHNLYIIEDCAEAHGAKYEDKYVGNFSDIATFSFFANKNITTGEGGMCITNSDKYDKLCRYYKNMCFAVDSPRAYIHNDIGFNYRMSNIHAAIGLAQVEKADEYCTMRIHNANIYRELLHDIPGIILQKDTPRATNTYWMNAIEIDEKTYGHTRDELAMHLKEYNIDTRLLFVGMHKQPSLKKYGVDCSSTYPETDKLSNCGLYLPSATNLQESTIEYICNVIKDYTK